MKFSEQKRIQLAVTLRIIFYIC